MRLFALVALDSRPLGRLPYLLGRRGPLALQCTVFEGQDLFGQVLNKHRKFLVGPALYLLVEPRLPRLRWFLPHAQRHVPGWRCRRHVRPGAHAVELRLQRIGRVAHLLGDQPGRIRVSHGTRHAGFVVGDMSALGLGIEQLVERGPARYAGLEGEHGALEPRADTARGVRVSGANAVLEGDLERLWGAQRSKSR